MALSHTICLHKISLKSKDSPARLYNAQQYFYSTFDDNFANSLLHIPKYALHSGGSGSNQVQVRETEGR